MHMAGEGEKTTIVLFASSENNPVSPDFIYSRSYQSYLSKCLEKAHISAPLLFTAYGIRLSWGLVIKNHCAHCHHMELSQIGALGSPFCLQMGKTHEVNSKAHLQPFLLPSV